MRRKPSGTKYDSGKLRWDLVFLDALEEVVRVSSYGATKYADRNCELGMPYGKLYAAAQRHLGARFIRGQKINPQDGNLLHLAQAAWSILLLLAYDLRGVDKKWDNLTAGKRVHETHPHKAKA